MLVRDPAAFAAAFAAAYPGVASAGTWSGAPTNRGERLHLIDAIGENILDSTYQDHWHPASDGRAAASPSSMNWPRPPLGTKPARAHRDRRPARRPHIS